MPTFYLPGGLVVQRGQAVPSPAPTLLEKAVKVAGEVVEEVVKPKRRGRKKKIETGG